MSARSCDLITLSGPTVSNLREALTTKSSFFLNQHIYFFHESRCKRIQTGIGRDHSERKGLPQAHQDLGAVWCFHEDPQRSEEVSLMA